MKRTVSPLSAPSQVNRLFSKVTGDEITSGYAVIHTESSPDNIMAWASVVDNLTNDPSFMLPVGY